MLSSRGGWRRRTARVARPRRARSGRGCRMAGRGRRRPGGRRGLRPAVRRGRRAPASRGSPRSTGPTPGSARSSARRSAGSRPGSSASVPSASAAATASTLAIRRAGPVRTSAPRSAIAAEVGNSRSAPGTASAGGSRSPSAAASRAGRRAGRRDRHLLAQQRADRRLGAVDRARQPDARHLLDGRGERRIGAQQLVDGDRVGVEVEQAPHPGHGGPEVARVGQPQRRRDVRGAAASALLPGGVAARPSPGRAGAAGCARTRRLRRSPRP